MRRLKTHSQFRAVLAGPRIASTAHFVLHQCDLTNVGLRPVNRIVHDGGAEAPGPELRSEPVMGAMVPKRWAKRAVTRNMIKRQIYTVASTAAPALPASSTALKHVVRQELTALFSNPRRPEITGGRMLAPQP